MVKSFARSHLRLMTDRMRQRIGARVKAARLRAGLSQETLAAKIRRTPESISNIERGQQLPALDTLLDLARVLDLALSEVLDVQTDERKLSQRRLLAESAIIETVKSLSDTAVEVALAQLAALRAVK